jgi:hypothetical protein
MHMNKLLSEIADNVSGKYRKPLDYGGNRGQTSVPKVATADGIRDSAYGDGAGMPTAVVQSSHHPREASLFEAFQRLCSAGFAEAATHAAPRLRAGAHRRFKYGEEYAPNRALKFSSPWRRS